MELNRRRNDIFLKIIAMLIMLLLSAYAYFGVEAKGEIKELQTNKVDRIEYYRDVDDIKAGISEIKIMLKEHAKEEVK